MALTIWTTGYEQHRTPEDLVSALQAAGVTRLLDVRELPLSRRRGFSKTKLSEALAAGGIRYEHEKALGNPKHLRDLYKSGDVAAGEAGYRKRITTDYAWAVDQLADSIAQDAPATAMLCWEADHAACHRSVIVDELRRRIPGLAVRNL
jgi:uncharacterized protein (DUF488 family)